MDEEQSCKFTEVTGDLLDDSVFGENIRVVPVNNRGCPKFDGGLAGAVWLKYPDVAKEYAIVCRTSKGLPDGGIGSQDGKWFFLDTMRGLDVMSAGLHILSHYNPKLPIAMPWVGCGIAGYTRNQIRPMLIKELYNRKVRVVGT